MPPLFTSPLYMYNAHLVSSGCSSHCQFTRSYGPEGFKDALDVFLCQIRMDGGNEDAVVLLRLLRDVVNHHLSLRHVAGPANFNVATGNDNAVHLGANKRNRFSYLFIWVDMDILTQ